MTQEEKDLLGSSIASSGSIVSLGNGVALTVVNSLMSILGSIGNVLVFATVFYTPSLRNNFGYYISNLAVADFLVTFIVQPMFIFNVVEATIQFKEVAPTVGLATEVVMITSCGASLGSLLFLSIDRCLCIVWPVRYRTLATKRRLKITIACVWLQASTTLVRYFGGFIPPEAFRFITFIYVLVLYCVICGCYALVFWKIRKQARFRRNMRLGIPKRQAFENAGVPGTRQENPRRNEASATEKKLARMIAVVVGVFTIAWAPIGFVFASRNNFDWTVILWAATIGLSSSSVNPIIYSYGSQECRSACWKLLKRCCTSIARKRNGGNDRVTRI